MFCNLPLHYATHDTRLTHGYRKLRLAEDFENHTSDAIFQNQASGATFQNLPPDATFQNQASDARFQNHASDVIFCDHASDVQYESGNVALKAYSLPGIETAQLSYRAYWPSALVGKAAVLVCTNQ